MANFIGLKDFEVKSSKDYKQAILHIETHLYSVLEDEVLLATILAGGRLNYLNVFQREFRSFKGVDREMAEMLWSVFIDQWKQRYGHLHPGSYLSQLEQHTPPSEQEIQDAWIVESASSDDARRYFGMA